MQHVADPGTARVQLAVKRMTCAACVNTVTTALESVPGVVRADVSLVLESANVVYRDGELTPSELSNAVAEAGYAATTIEPSAELDSRADTDQSDIANQLLTRALLSIAAAVAIMAAMWTLAASGLGEGFAIALNVAAWAVATPVLVWVGGSFYRGAWAAAKRKTSNMDTLIAVGVSAAYCYSAAVTVAQIWTGNANVIGDVATTDGNTYFEVAAAIIGLVTLGRWMEANTRRKSSEAVKRLVEMRPQVATVEVDGARVEVPIDQVSLGEIVLVRTGERFAVDGIIDSGTCEVDESMLTGESVPAVKSAGDAVYAGTVSVNGAVRVTSKAVGDETLLSDITRHVASALTSRAPVERLVDTITRYFVPAILGIAILTFALWLVLGPQPSLPSAIIAATTVLVISCPCALGLATPAAVVAGIGRASEMGALIRNAEALERLTATDTAVLDKTGTITEGKMQLVATHVQRGTGIGRDQALALAASVESQSEHPVGKAIVDHANRRGIATPACHDFQNQPGVGVSGLVDGRHVAVSRARNASTAAAGLPESLSAAVDQTQRDAQTAVLVTVDAAPVAVIALADSVREGAPCAIADLKAMGVQTHLLTGDSAVVAKSVAKAVGVDAAWAQVSPTGKSATVQRLRDQGRTVAMVGDGINDGPALATADVGIAMGAGTDVAIEAADVALLSNDLSAVPRVIRLARATVRTIRTNLAWAFGYNLLLVPIAAGVLIPVFAESSAPAILRPVMSAEGTLNPIAAAAAMALSSLSVSLNALRLRRFR